jgi:biofilm PGA synthesis N-glycosyltransferase PgaC
MIILILLFWLAWGLVLYAYVVFPLLIALFAKLAGRNKSLGKTEDENNLPRVAMVVAAYNEEQFIRAKLENTWQIDYPADRFEILIGSDGSGDNTAGILKQCTDPRLRCFLFPERRGKISVVNDLVKHVDADIIVMSDASTMFARDAVKNLVRHFDDPQVGCVTGELSIRREGDVSGEGAYLKYERWIKRNEGRIGCVMGCVGAIFAIRPDLYEPLPASTIVEDFVLCLRVLEKGYLAISDPEAKAVDPPCLNPRGEIARKIRIGAGGFQALGLTHSLLHPRYGLRAFAYMGHKVLRWCVPFFALIGFGTCIPLALNSFQYKVLLALQILGAFLSLWAYHKSEKGRLPVWVRPISYFYLMNYSLFCGFLRFLFRTQKVTWDRAIPAAVAVVADAQSLSKQTALESVNGG